MPGKSRVRALSARAVDLEIAALQRAQTLHIGIGKSKAHQAPRTMAHGRAHLLERQWREPVLAAQRVSAPTMSGAVSSSVPSRSNNTARKLDSRGRGGNAPDN